MSMRLRHLTHSTAAPTPSTIEGPFYPDIVPTNAGKDLIGTPDEVAPSHAQVTTLRGRLTGVSGSPLHLAVVEIWQVDSQGSYNHSTGLSAEGRDTWFKGYGKCVTDRQGRYRFRTIAPRAYSLLGIFRAPHIHLAVSVNGRRVLTTQFGILGHASNVDDPLYRGLTTDDRNRLLVPFEASASRPGELTARFDIVVLDPHPDVSATPTAAVGPPLLRTPARGWATLAKASRRQG
jgi:protocatechuate 3,4-dioxygenase, beta subunit